MSLMFVVMIYTFFDVQFTSLVVGMVSQTEFENPHRVVQMQYTGWPDMGVPDDSSAIRSIIHDIEKERADDPDPSRPIVVHCSAGLGRTSSIKSLCR